MDKDRKAAPCYDGHRLLQNSPLRYGKIQSRNFAGEM